MSFATYKPQVPRLFAEIIRTQQIIGGIRALMIAGGTDYPDHDQQFEMTPQNFRELARAYRSHSADLGRLRDASRRRQGAAPRDIRA
jgi:hypothetical protein